MAIKRLRSEINEDVELELNSTSAILTFNCNEKNECFYLNKAGVDELRKLETFTNPSDIKFVGPKTILTQIQQMRFEWPNFKKEVLISEPVKAIFYSKTGKVRVDRRLFVKKKVLIIDDSKTIQKILKKIISESKLLECVGAADDPIIAKEMIEANKPDLITLDMHMPNMTGLEFLKSYLHKKNIPTVMITSLGINEGSEVMEALANGAHGYIQKPAADKIGSQKFEIIEKLESLAQIKLSNNLSETNSNKNLLNFSDTEKGFIAIGSSTGGTQALEKIFLNLPANIPPIVVVQHIPAVFSKALADRLNQLCEFTVKEAEDGEFLKCNHIYIAPGGKQMKVVKRGVEQKILITDDPPLNRFQPSVDYLFNTLPSLQEKALVAVILTGMGKDGAKGLLELKNSGAYTIAQDEDSCVVFGMPKEAIRIEAVKKVVALDDMAQNIVTQFNILLKKYN